MNGNERKLLKLARNGCVAAFEELIEPHQRRIYNLMFKICGNEFEASQLAQDVFVKVFNSIVLCKDEGSLICDIYRAAGEISRMAACTSKKIS